MLAPAGSQEALVSAVRCGADAVYLGAGPFHARQNAQNFTLDSLSEVCRYCHARGVDVHLTMNTLIQQDELPQALEVAKAACAAGIDAVIVQDLGLAALLHHCAPDLRLHASTQCSVHTPEGVRALADLGFHRVILAREMTRQEIAAACAVAHEVGVEVEVFVHGAQCMSVSGQCRMSAMLGGRSANRGQCAQPCRLPFRTPGGTGFDLSLMDLSLLPYVEELSAMGVASLKIEGRMKRPEYVAAAVNAYRQALDGAMPGPEETERLKTVFSRGGLTAAYYEGKRGREMFGRRTGEDSRAAKETYAPLHALYRIERQSVRVALSLKQEQDQLVLTADDGQGNIGRACQVVEGEILSALEGERLLRQLQKSGGTPFAITSVSLPEGEVHARLSEINDLRRRALDSLYEQRAAVRPIAMDSSRWEAESAALVHARAQGRALPLWVRFGLSDQIPENLEFLSRMERIFLPAEWEDSVFRRLMDAGLRVGMDLPRAFFDRETILTHRMEHLHSLGVDMALVHNMASVHAAVSLGLAVCGGEGLNVSNAAAVSSLRKAGVGALTLNPELTLPQAQAVGEGGLVIYGRLPLMLTRNCPAANGGQCRFLGGECGGQGTLTDRKGIDFPVVCRYGCSEVLNSRPIWMADRLREVAFASFGLLWLTVESPNETAQVLEAYEQGGSPPEQYTRGLYYRGSNQARSSR